MVGLPAAPCLEPRLLPSQTRGLLCNSGATGVIRLWCRCSHAQEHLWSATWSQGIPGLPTSVGILYSWEQKVRLPLNHVRLRSHTQEEVSEDCENHSLPRPVEFLTIESQRWRGYIIRANIAARIIQSYIGMETKKPQPYSLFQFWVFNACSKNPAKTKVDFFVFF